MLISDVWMLISDVWMLDTPDFDKVACGFVGITDIKESRCCKLVERLITPDLQLFRY